MHFLKKLQKTWESAEILSSQQQIEEEIIKRSSENLFAIKINKTTKVNMNKPVYLDLSILAISKTLMHQFWYDYIKPKCKIMLHGYR